MNPARRAMWIEARRRARGRAEEQVSSYPTVTFFFYPVATITPWGQCQKIAKSIIRFKKNKQQCLICEDDKTKHPKHRLCTRPRSCHTHTPWNRQQMPSCRWWFVAFWVLFLSLHLSAVLIIPSLYDKPNRTESLLWDTEGYSTKVILR